MHDYLAIKQIGEPEEDSSYCARLGRFIRNNKLLVAGALTLTTGAIYLLSKAKSSDAINNPSDDSMANNDQRVHKRVKRLVGGRPVESAVNVEENKARAVYVYMRVGEQSAAACTGSALSEDTILTAAHCVTIENRSAEQICRFSNGTVVSTEEYNKLKDASSYSYSDYADYYDSSYSETPFDEVTTASASSGVEHSYDPSEILQDITCQPAFKEVIEMPAKNVTIMYGTERGYDKLYSQRYNVEQIIRHSDFNFTQGDAVNDIALIKLQKPIKDIPLSVLPTEDINAAFRKEIKANHDLASAEYLDNLYLQGWGRKENPNPPPDDIFSLDKKLTVETEHLLELNLTAVSQFDGQSCDVMICSKGAGKGICAGDSGGPVFYRDRDTGDMYQVGVTSGGSVSCTSGDSVHSDVFRHKDWIKQQMKKLGTTTKSDRNDIYAAQARKEFNDTLSSDSTQKSKVDCDAHKIARLEIENQRQKQKAMECAANNVRKNGQICNEKQARAKVFQSEVDFRSKRCEPNNGKGMTLQERFKLSLDREPEFESCAITNNNNKDILAFTPDGNPKQKINVLPILVHDGVADSSDDCVIAIKQIDEPEEDLSACARLGRFINKHKLLLAMGAASLSLVYLLSRYASASTSEPSDENKTEHDNEGAHQSLIGGTSVEKGDKKYAVFIYTEVDAEKAAECTGSALTEDTILTAAHCVTIEKQSDEQICKFSNGTIISQEDYKKLTGWNYEDYSEGSEMSLLDYSTAPMRNAAASVFLDEDTDIDILLNDITCEPVSREVVEIKPQNVTVMYGTERGAGKLYARWYQAAQIVRHPDFDISLGGAKNDVVIIKLESPIPGIPLVTLPTDEVNSAFRREVAANYDLTGAKYPDNLYLQGWGKTNNPNAITIIDGSGKVVHSLVEAPTTYTDRLLQLNLTAINNHKREGNCSTIICSTGADKEICSGDSGGPVFYKERETGNMYQVGVNSKATAMCSFGLSLHTDVFLHKSWIEQQMTVLNSATENTRYKTFAQQARRVFEIKDTWNSYYTQRVKVDCNAEKIAKLEAETRRQQGRAKACAANPARRNTSNCRERQAKARGYQFEVNFRKANCVNNGKGMVLQQRYNLATGMEPKLVSCSLTNQNNLDVLTFVAKDDPRQKINLMPEQTVACVKDGSRTGFYFTEGRVTRPTDQIEAWEQSQSRSLADQTSETDVIISANKTAIAGQSFQPTNCGIVNKGKKILKFKFDSNNRHIKSKHVWVMPESEIPCDKSNPNVPAGRLLDPHIREFPTQRFTVLNISNERMCIRLAEENVATRGKAFIFDDKYYMEPVSTSSGSVVFTLKSALPQQPTKLRLVDKNSL